jgi:lipoprotein-releasing system permease protein
MNFPLFIARRYILSKKSTNAINVISGISVAGITIATMALVVVLSVFNGFQDLVSTLLTNFDPQLKITAVTGKSMPADDPALLKVKSMPEIQIATESVEDLVVAVYNGRQVMLTLKGVEDNFAELTKISDCLYGNGDFCLHAGALEYGIVGARAAQLLGSDVHWKDYMKIYAAQREGQLDLSNPETGFVVDSLMLPPVVFSVGQSKYDKNVILAPIAFARRMFDMQGEMTSLELRLKEGESVDKVKAEIKSIVGDKYNVLDRYEQQADTFRIMQIEKVLAYVFLTFILIVACFNIIGSISMLIIDKKKDVETLRNLGASERQISRIFLFEGRIITAIGAVVGIALGLLICWLQQQYGIVKMGTGGNYIVVAYPVSVHYIDVLIVFATVTIVGWIAVWYPVRHMSRKLLGDRE